MKKLFSLVIIGFFVFGINAAGFAEEKLVIPGSGDPQELLRVIAKEFEMAHPGTVIEIPESIGSTGGIKAVINGTAELARVARLPRERERVAGLTYVEFSKAPVGFVVHPSISLIDDLTRDQILGIYRGKIRSWKEVEGPIAKIYAVQREPGETSRAIIEKQFPEFGQTEFDVKTVYSTPNMVKTLMGHQYTIGYFSLGMLKGTDLEVLSIDGIAPTAENIRSGKYAFVGPLGFVWKGELSSLAKRFMEFMRSPEAQEIMQNFGVIPAE